MSWLDPLYASGLYVLAEKPIAPALAEASQLCALESSVLDRLQIGFTYRHDPAIERLRELVTSGAFGSPLLIRIGFFDEPADPERNPEHFRRIVETMRHGAPIVHEGAHICDWLNLFLDAAPVDVGAWGLRTDAAFTTPNLNGFSITYGDGTIAMIEVAWLYPLGRFPKSYITLTGPSGHAELDPDSFQLRFNAGTHVEILSGKQDRRVRCFGIQLDRFVTSFEAGSAPVPGIREAVASLSFTDLLETALTSVERRLL